MPAPKPARGTRRLGFARLQRAPQAAGGDGSIFKAVHRLHAGQRVPQPDQAAQRLVLCQLIQLSFAGKGNAPIGRFHTVLDAGEFVLGGEEEN